MILKNYLFYLIMLITLTGANRVSTRDASIGKEYALKSEFLYRFVDYVHWKNYSKEQSFKIAVLESSRITASLQRTTHNKKIEIKEYKFLKEIHSCQILFIPYNSSIPIEKILYYFSGKPVLIVPEKNLWTKGSAYEFCYDRR